MIIWWSKHVGVILRVLVCDMWIIVLLQTSTLVGPLYIILDIQVCTVRPRVQTLPDLHSFKEVKKKDWNNHFFRRAPYFSSREWKHFETVVAEEYCWAMRPIRFLGVGDSSPYKNTQFRLALVLPERNCCLIRGVSVAYLFTQNISPASCVWFCACHMNQRL
jgi:hypothetical protein